MWQRIVLKAEGQLLSLGEVLANRRAVHSSQSFLLISSNALSKEMPRARLLSSYKSVARLKRLKRFMSTVPLPPGLNQDPVKTTQNDVIDLDDELFHLGRSGLQNDPFTNEHDGEEDEEYTNARHIPVMAKEVLSCFKLKSKELIVDMTFGAGGHAKHILKSFPDVRYVAVDRDPLAFGLAKELAAQHREGQVTPILSKFSDVCGHLKSAGIEPGTVDAVLMDLGVSSMQFDTPDRGFSISKDGPLDMRMDGTQCADTPTAADVVNSLDPHHLALILRKYGEERHAKAVAHAIVEARYAFGHFTSTKQLSDVIKSVFGIGDVFNTDKLNRPSHMATKSFQALRIFVNDEMNQLHNGLRVAHHILRPSGACAVISFHSLEDRIVKRHFNGIDLDLDLNMSIHGHLRDSRVIRDNAEIREKVLEMDWHPVSRKVMEASIQEVKCNPRARSSKLRVALKSEREIDKGSV